MKQTQLHSVAQSRSGIVTFWALVSVPVFGLMLCFVLEIGNLWLARIQLKNALEAGALAAVKHWGDSGGDSGDTENSRIVGTQFASSCMINGIPVDLTTIDASRNYSLGGGTNQNASCQGVFVFGSIDTDTPEYTFDSCSAAGCGPPYVLAMDLTAQGNLNSGNNNEWGISIQPSNSTMTSTVTVRRIVYRIPAGAFFDFISDPPTVSGNLTDNAGSNAVNCTGGGGSFDCPDNTDAGTNSQADVFGVNPAQIDFYINVADGDECVLGAGTPITMGGAGMTSSTLAIEFCDGSIPGCNPFNLGDRIRFGAVVTPNGGGQIDADEVGALGLEITVCFSDGTQLEGVFQDSTHTGNCGCAAATIAPWGNCPSPIQGLTIHPAGIPDIPCPPGPADNNGQALVAFQMSPGGAGSGLGYAVRAQVTYPVPSLCEKLFGWPVGPFSVTAKTDAVYECTTSNPRIYHLDDADITCVTPCP